MNATSLLIECYRVGLRLLVNGDSLSYTGPRDQVNRLLPSLAENKADILVVLSLVPAKIELRIADLVACGEFDGVDADDVRARYHRYPDEWDFILTCCEQMAAERQGANARLQRATPGARASSR